MIKTPSNTTQAKSHAKTSATSCGVGSRAGLLFSVMAVVCFGCKSTEHARSTAVPVQEITEQDAGAHAPLPEESAAPKAAFDCSQRPMRTCCEALTPACNDCREQEQEDLRAWQAACTKEGGLPQGCSGAPPVVACCSDPSDECRACQAAALDQLTAWKAACADAEEMTCDQQPPTQPCCEALTPSCDACRERNKRLEAAWQQRCDQP